MQVVRTCPHVEEGDAPEAQDRQPIGEDRPLRPDGQIIVEHAEEARRQEKGDRVVPVPPLHHRVLDARPDRVALGMSPRDWQGEVVDDVKDRNDQDERHEIPVGDVDVRLLPARDRPDIEDEVGDPDDDQPEVGVPLGLGVLLGLGDAHQIARDGQHAEKIVAEKHEPWAELARQPGPRGALDDVERGRNQRVAAEAEDHARRVRRPKPSEAGPGGVEGEVGPRELRCHPDAHEHPEHRPSHRKRDADLDGIVVIRGFPVFRRLRLVEREQDDVEQTDRKEHDDQAVDTKHVRASERRHCCAGYRDSGCND